jgi:hypothetical protein
MSSKFTLTARIIAFSLAVCAAPTVFADCGGGDLCRVSGVEGRTDNNRLNAHISPSRTSSIKFSLREGDEVRNRSCESSRGERWCKVEMPDNSYMFGWVLASYLREAGRGGGHRGGTSMEYKRGYNDGLKGNEFDTDRHPQDYKDGYRAGEEARREGPRSGASDADHSINRLSNGGFEVVWPQKGCIASYNRKGQSMNYSSGCTDDLISRSNRIAKRER